MKYIIGKHSLLWILAVVFVLLTGCQSDDVNDGQRTTSIDLQTFMRAYDEAQQPASTRAWTPPSGFYSYSTMLWDWNSDLTNSSIGIYFTKGTSAPIAGQFVYNNSKWKTNIKIAEMSEGTYYLYGYIPATEASATIETSGASYANGATLKLNLPTVTTYDYCVTVGAKRGSAPPATLDGSVTGLRLGDFSYELVHNEDNHIYLLFDHLYAAVQFKIRVNEKYNALRRIKLKQLKLVGYNDNTKFKSNSIITVGLEPTDGSSSPIKSITFEPDPNSAEATLGPLFQSDDGLLLTTNYQNCYGNFVPFGISDLSLESIYDVYDTDPIDGHPVNLIRENQTAVNKIYTSVLFDENLKRGTIYTIYMTVNPTYLYMMSEPDLENPMPVVDGGS